MTLPSDQSHTRESGLALVSVLWALSILSLIAATILSASVLSSRLERNEWRRAERNARVEAALNRAALSLIDARAEARWRIDGGPRDFEFGGAKVRIAVQDELGKVDINTANDDLVRGLIRTLGLPPAQSDALADRILDWRTPGGLKRLSGADQTDYRAAGSRYRPRGAAFQSIDELNLVMGMTPALFARLAPAVTVYSQKATIDPQTAPEAALLALPGMDAQKADNMIAARSESVFAGGEEARRSPGILTQGISLAGRAFTIDVSGDQAGRTYHRRFVVRLIDEAKGGYWILAWR